MPSSSPSHAIPFQINKNISLCIECVGFMELFDNSFQLSIPYRFVLCAFSSSSFSSVFLFPSFVYILCCYYRANEDYFAIAIANANNNNQMRILNMSSQKCKHFLKACLRINLLRNDTILEYSSNGIW